MPERRYVLENDKGGAGTPILGRNHCGLSGGRAFGYAAGEMVFSPTGELLQMTRRSGHYRPAVKNLERAREYLRKCGLLSSRGVELIESTP
ncbi:MAG: hypothetical protein WKG00_09945 [Polyangiaceae bacterium]